MECFFNSTFDSPISSTGAGIFSQEKNKNAARAKGDNFFEFIFAYGLKVLPNLKAKLNSYHHCIMTPLLNTGKDLEAYIKVLFGMGRKILILQFLFSVNNLFNGGYYPVPSEVRAANYEERYYIKGRRTTANLGIKISL